MWLCRYCENQLLNKSTRAVLAKSFEHLGSDGELFVERYMREVLFDHEFHYDTAAATKEALLKENEGLGLPAPDMEAQSRAVDAAFSAMKAGDAEEAVEKEIKASARDYFRDV